MQEVVAFLLTEVKPDFLLYVHTTLFRTDSLQILHSLYALQVGVDVERRRYKEKF